MRETSYTVFLFEFDKDSHAAGAYHYIGEVYDEDVVGKDMSSILSNIHGQRHKLIKSTKLWTSISVLRGVSRPSLTKQPPFNGRGISRKLPDTRRNSQKMFRTAGFSTKFCSWIPHQFSVCALWLGVVFSPACPMLSLQETNSCFAHSRTFCLGKSLKMWRH